MRLLNIYSETTTWVLSWVAILAGTAMGGGLG